MNNVEEVYSHIKDFIEEKGFPPSARQIANELKLNYENEVVPAIEELKDKGRILFEETKDTIISIIDE